MTDTDTWQVSVCVEPLEGDDRRACLDALRPDLCGYLLEHLADPPLGLCALPLVGTESTAWEVSFSVMAGGVSDIVVVVVVLTMLAGLAPLAFLLVGPDFAIDKDVEGRERHALGPRHRDDLALKVALHDVPAALVD